MRLLEVKKGSYVQLANVCKFELENRDDSSKVLLRMYFVGGQNEAVIVNKSEIVEFLDNFAEETVYGLSEEG